MKNVMTKAWEIAREGQSKFGGKVSEYLSEAMKIAWSFYKTAGDDSQLLARVKNMLVAKWKENKETLLPHFGTCTVYIKVILSENIRFYTMTTEEKTQLSNGLKEYGF